MSLPFSNWSTLGAVDLSLFTVVESSSYVNHMVIVMGVHDE
jgi:hypothetical protein